MAGHWPAPSGPFTLSTGEAGRFSHLRPEPAARLAKRPTTSAASRIDGPAPLGYSTGYGLATRMSSLEISPTSRRCFFSIGGGAGSHRCCRQPDRRLFGCATRRRRSGYREPDLVDVDPTGAARSRPMKPGRAPHILPEKEDGGPPERAPVLASSRLPRPRTPGGCRRRRIAAV